jgi:hypothetical protein
MLGQLRRPVEVAVDLLEEGDDGVHATSLEVDACPTLGERPPSNKRPGTVRWREAGAPR